MILMLLFNSRLYSLSINNFHKYSFIYFYLLYSHLKVNNLFVKMSILYNSILNKKGKLFLYYVHNREYCFNITFYTKVFNHMLKFVILSYNKYAYTYLFFKQNIKLRIKNMLDSFRHLDTVLGNIFLMLKWLKVMYHSCRNIKKFKFKCLL